MTDNTAYETFSEIKRYYDAIEYPKYRNVELIVFKEKYAALIRFKKDLETVLYVRLQLWSTAG